jgi:stearoyl-CoA desaturase (delta-9 desaturase)
MTKLATYAHPDRYRPHVPIAIASIHLLACAAPFCYSSLGLVLLLLLAPATFLLGVTLGFHRLLAHRSFRAWPPFETLMTLLGTLTLEGGPILWVAVHRLHHKRPDSEDDPHTPLAGFSWAHYQWISYKHPMLIDRAACVRFVPDLDRRPAVRWLESHYYPVNIACGLGLFALGCAWGGLPLGLSALVWGGFLRIVLVWHVTFLVNSATHTWGYRSYATRDNSRNCWWVALLTFGEGWHNNHHADPTSASFGHRWFEIDLGYRTLQALRCAGLVWKITGRRRKAHSMKDHPASVGGEKLLLPSGEHGAAAIIDATGAGEELWSRRVMKENTTHES